MRYVIYGAGAIGGVLGARLFRARHEVALIARGDHLRAMKADGLLAKLPEGEFNLPIPCFAGPGEVGLGNGDVVLMAMKTQDTELALQHMEEAGATDLPVLCIQNGVENERLASRGFERVYGGYVFLPAVFLNPGEVECATTPTAGCIDLGRYPSGADTLLEEIAGDFKSASIDSIVRTDIMRWKHAKLLSNLTNSVDAVLGPTAARSAPDIREHLLVEGRAVLEAAGIPYASDVETQKRRAEMDLHFVGAPGRGGGST